MDLIVYVLDWFLLLFLGGLPSDVLGSPADGEGDVPGHPALLVEPGDRELGVEVLLLQELLDPLLVDGVQRHVVLEAELAVEEPALRGLEHLLLDDGHDVVEPLRSLALRETSGEDADRVLDVAEVLEAAYLRGITADCRHFSFKIQFSGSYLFIIVVSILCYVMHSLFFSEVCCCCALCFVVLLFVVVT